MMLMIWRRERKGKSCCYMYVYIPTDLSKRISFFFSFCFFVSPRGDFLLHDSQDRARILVISLETETVFCQVVGCNLYELVGEGGYASVSLLSYIQLAVCCFPTLAVCARLTDVV